MNCDHLFFRCFESINGSKIDRAWIELNYKIIIIIIIDPIDDEFGVPYMAGRQL